jgi:hypothetical protein
LLGLEKKVHGFVEDLIEGGQHGVRKAHRPAGDGKTELYVADTSLQMFKAYLIALLRLEEVDGRLFLLDLGTLMMQSRIFDLVEGGIVGPGWGFAKGRVNPFFGCQEPTDTEESSQESSQEI